MADVSPIAVSARPITVADDLAADLARRARLLRRLSLVMTCLGLLGAVTSLLQAANDPVTSVAFYALVISPMALVWWMARRGRIEPAAWLLTGLFWVIIAVVTLVFGGLKGQNASSFACCVLLIGSLVGARPALAVAVVSSAWCGLVAFLESQGRLPHQLGVYTPANGWVAVTTTLLLTAFLLASSLEWLRQLHARAERSARERDEALRRSIEGQKLELVGKVTAGIAHDFNNLLTVMTTVGELLRDEVAAPSSASLLDTLDEAVSRATLLTRQLVSFGRGPGTERGPVDVGDAVTALARMLPALLGPRVGLEVHAPAGAVAAVPRAAIEQIVLNLAVNAKEAMPDGGRLRLEVAARDTMVVLTAVDEGIGMDPATCARAFEPFFSTKATGTGLGLATVRRLVDELGGKVTVTSTPGAGAQFVVELPRVDAVVPGRAPPASAAVRVAARAGRVMVVEDDALVRPTLIRALLGCGYEPVSVCGGAEALALLDAGAEFACVVTDLSMPGMDGEALAARVAELRPSLPVVMISGDRQPAIAVAPRRSFVAKPIDAVALAAAVDRAIAGA